MHIQRIDLAIIHNSFFLLSVCLSECVDSNSFQTAGGSSLNFQGVIRAPHCMSSRNFFQIGWLWV